MLILVLLAFFNDGLMNKFVEKIVFFRFFTEGVLTMRTVPNQQKRHRWDVKNKLQKAV